MHDLLETAAHWLEQWRRRYRVPGLAWVTSDRGRTRRVLLSGVADRAGGRPLRPDQRWQIGSISKAFTSIAVLQLQREGLLNVHDPVRQHVPWAEHLRPDVTLHHLMSHTAGLPEGHEWTPDSRLESAVQGLVGDPQPPGVAYHYSNPGYELLGDVVEAVTRTPLETHLERHVLDTMGMTGATASVSWEHYDRDVVGHRPIRDDAPYRAESDQIPAPWYPTCTADGAIAATPEDVSTYVRFLLAGGMPGVLDPDDFAALAGRQATINASAWYGYGLRTELAGGRELLGHSGGMIAMFADVVVDREAGYGSALLTNGSGPMWEANAALQAWLHPDDPVPLPPVESLPWPEVPDDDASGGPDLVPMVGLYRSYTPWVPCYRVVRRAGELVMVVPEEGETRPLVPVTPTRFRLGHAASPEIVDFSVLVDGEYLRMDVSGTLFGRARRG